MQPREELYLRLLERIGREELERAKALIGSTTLREAMELLVDINEGQARLYIPHYWAEYYHDGHGPVVPVDARWIVFFADPEDDPRLAQGYPIRASDIVRLTKEQYEEGLAINAERRREGQPPYMIVVPRTGPAGPHPFFDDLAVGAADRIEPEVMQEFDTLIQGLIDTDPDIKPEKDRAEFSL